MVVIFAADYDRAIILEELEDHQDAVATLRSHCRPNPVVPISKVCLSMREDVSKDFLEAQVILVVLSCNCGREKKHK